MPTTGIRYMALDFYPRPPRGGRLLLQCCLCPVKEISIHALREEGDDELNVLSDKSTKFLSTPSARRATENSRSPAARAGISIHALREEGDLVWMTPASLNLSFLSTPSARRATHPGNRSPAGSGISIHALREEGDAGPLLLLQRHPYFYPRPPRGGRLSGPKDSFDAKIFLSTPSARRATSRAR